MTYVSPSSPRRQASARRLVGHARDAISPQQLEIENRAMKTSFPKRDGPRDLPHDPAQHPEPTLRTIEPVPYPARHRERLLLCFRMEPLRADIGPVKRRSTGAPALRLRTPGRSEAQAGLPIASGPSLFVQPGIDLRHQDRTKGKFPGLRLSRQSAEVAAGRSDRRATL